MAIEKLVYVPRNWKVSYVDDIGNEHNNVPLSADKEYRVMTNGMPVNITVGGIRTEGEKTFITPKTALFPGFMNVIDIPTGEIDMDTVSEITRIRSRYNRATRSNKDKQVSENDEIFTFAFDSEKYSSKYKISICKGEFVALAVPDPKNAGKSRAYYGHITGISPDDQYVIMNRYISNHGVREIKIGFKIPIANLLGIYRYELEIEDYTEPTKKEEPVDAEPQTEAPVEAEVAETPAVEATGAIPEEIFEHLAADTAPVTDAFNVSE